MQHFATSHFPQNIFPFAAAQPGHFIFSRYSHSPQYTPHLAANASGIGISFGNVFLKLRSMTDIAESSRGLPLHMTVKLCFPMNGPDKAFGTALGVTH